MLNYSQMATTNTNTKNQLLSVATQLYSLVVWLLIIAGGMLLVGSFFITSLTVTDHISGFTVGLITVVFGLGLARLLNKDIKQTAPVFWF